MSRNINKIRVNNEDYFIRDSLATQNSLNLDKINEDANKILKFSYNSGSLNNISDYDRKIFNYDNINFFNYSKNVLGTYIATPSNIPFNSFYQAIARTDFSNLIDSYKNKFGEYYDLFFKEIIEAVATAYNSYITKFKDKNYENNFITVQNAEPEYSDDGDIIRYFVEQITGDYYGYPLKIENKMYYFPYSDTGNKFETPSDLEQKVGENSQFLIPNGTVFGTSNSVTGITFNNTEIIAGKYKIFGGDIIKGLLGNTVVYPEWWGAVGDGITDDSDAIQAAIDNAGHIPVVLTSQKGYLVKKTINLIEPFGKEKINSHFGYLNKNGNKYNSYQTLIVQHDIIGDESLAGPVIRTGANMNRIEVRGAIVVRNSSDDAVGISCAGTQFKTNPYDPTSGPDNINTGDLGVMQDIKINAIIKGRDSFPYYEPDYFYANGIGRGTAVLYGGGNGSVLDVRHIYGFENGVWITFANGCKIDIGECACLNDIRIDGTVNTWGGGVTRNKIRLGTHNLNKNWDWVKNAHNNNKDISIIYIASNASVNYPNVECSNNEISVGGNNVVNDYCTYNYIVNKVGNSQFTGNKITVSNTLVGSKVAGNWLPVRIKADGFGTKVNNGNRICNDVTFDYDTISINYALNTECSPVIIDGNTHSNCYRGFSNTEEETTRFLLDKVAYTYIKGTTVLDDDSKELVKGASKVLFPHYSQLYKCHVVDSVDTSKASTYSKGHLYILKNSTLTDSPQYHAAYGWHNNKFELLGYYVDTFGLIK